MTNTTVTDSPDTAENTHDAQTRTLSTSDRCDSCGAQAFIAAVVNGTELLFCGHHGRNYADKLKDIAERWHDETDRLGALNAL